MKKEVSKIICLIAFVIGTLLVISSLCSFVFFRNSIFRVPILGELSLSPLDLAKANSTFNTPLQRLINGLSSNRILFLIFGFCCIVFGLLVYFHIKKQSKLFPGSYGEIMGKIRNVFIAIFGVFILGCGLYGCFTYASYNFNFDFKIVQSSIRSMLSDNIYLQDRIKLISISSYPSLIFLGICIALWGVLFYYLWTIQEKIGKG